MKKVKIVSIALLSTLLLAGCGNNSQAKTDKKAESISLKKKESLKAKKASEKKAQESRKKASSIKTKQESEKQAQASSSSATQQQSQAQQSQQQPTQGEINRQRGYDPKGNAVMPGQDHAPGSDVYGNSDDWVKGQDEWLKEQGIVDSNGNETQNFKNWSSQRDDAWDNGQEDFPDYDQNQQW